MTWTMTGIQAVHEWRQGAHTRLMRRYENEPDAGRVVEELVSDLVSSVIERTECIAMEEATNRVTADHVGIAVQQMNLRVRVMIERGLHSAA